MEPTPEKPSAAGVPRVAGSLALIFAVLSWPLSSVGWLFCCAATVVTMIVAGIFGVLALSEEKRFHARAWTGVALALLSGLILFLSYRHVVAGDRL